ncbi:Ctr copper transporter family-domain-containing protein [Poronia punctata]|nr:Ctr copper transporter family-domain-containing protein [Poronia punctata]
MDHSHMDHGDMDHGGHGGHGGGGDDMPMCNMNMLFTWDTSNLCIVFRQWRITNTASLFFSLLAIMAICAGYEALREASRKYELWLTSSQTNANNNNQEEEEQPAENTPFLGITGRINNNDSLVIISPRARVLKAVLYAVQNFYAFMIM